MNPSLNSTALDPPASAPASSEVVSQSEIEQLLAQVERADPSATGAGAAVPLNPAGPEFVRRHAFPALCLFSSAELRWLRVRHEDFIVSLAARLSIHLGLEVALQMSKLEAVPFQRFADALSNPTYLTMFKLPPLAGTCLLDIPPRLGLCMVDRELGGPARAPDETHQVGKMESRLLSRIVEIIVNEWCSTWSDLLEVRPTVLGTESNSRFVHTSSPETSMLVVGVEARLADTVEQMQFAFPHPMLEPLTLKLNAGVSGGDKPDAAVKSAPAKWNSLFDELEIQVKAELPEIPIPAEQLAGLKPGDVLTLPPALMNQVQLRLANHPGFVGSLGASNQRRAIRIEKSLKSK
ncbi:MAG: FliM/FliN family flagellar motor switch protein [Verrucomicrobiota bacterium]|jgi:flagellar motor switch protein FliM